MRAPAAGGAGCEALARRRHSGSTRRIHRLAAANGRWQATAAAWLALLAGLGGCDRQAGAPAGPVPATDSAATLAVEFSGCEAVLTGPRCLLAEDAGVVVWARTGPSTRLEVRRAGGGRREPVGEADGGFRFEIGGAAGSWIVVAGLGDGERRFRLELARLDEPSWLTRAREAFAAGDEAAARRHLESRPETAPPAEAGAVLGLRARLAYRDGRHEEAEEHLRRSIAAHEAAGNTLGAVNDASMLVFLLQRRRAMEDARVLLESLEHPESGSSEALYYVDYYRGLVARDSGDLRLAARALGEAAGHARRVGLTRERVIAEQSLATTLERAGRNRESAALFARLADELQRAPESIGPCDRGQVLNNHGWHLVLALEAGESAVDPVPFLERALEVFEGECGHLPEERVNARLNLAFAEVLQGRPEAARRRLATAARAAADGDAEPRMELWRRHVEGLVEMAEDDPHRALKSWERLREEAGAAALPELEWRAQIGRATAHRRLGEVADALAAYARAESILERESLQVALQTGRQTFVANRERGTREYLELLLEEGQAARAMEVARRARSRVVRGVGRRGGLEGLLPAERATLERAAARHRAPSGQRAAPPAEAWRLPADALRRLDAIKRSDRERLRRRVDDLLAAVGSSSGALALELAPPPRGVVLLAYHPLPEGWAAFALDADGVEAHRAPLLEPSLDSPEALAQHLLEPFAAKITASRRVRVLPYGALATVEIHALPFAGEPLLATREVEYGLDLPDPGSIGLEGPRLALVVGDPTGDLPAARAEARRVEAEVASRGWPVLVRIGERAGYGTVWEALAEATLFHYAGHAEFGPAGDWRSRLPLSGRASLSVEDVLTLPSVPEVVVLSGCETAVSVEAARGESLGMAQAFLVAGSRRVVATSRPVDDRYAAEIVSGLYAAWRGGRGVGEALRSAQLALREAEPGAPWESFRVLSR